MSSFLVLGGCYMGILGVVEADDFESAATKCGGYLLQEQPWRAQVSPIRWVGFSEDAWSDQGNMLPLWYRLREKFGARLLSWRGILYLELQQIPDLPFSMSPALTKNPFEVAGI